MSFGMIGGCCVERFSRARRFFNQSLPRDYLLSPPPSPPLLDRPLLSPLSVLPASAASFGSSAPPLFSLRLPLLAPRHRTYYYSQFVCLVALLPLPLLRTACRLLFFLIHAPLRVPPLDAGRRHRLGLVVSREDASHLLRRPAARRSSPSSFSSSFSLFRRVPETRACIATDRR